MDIFHALVLGAVQGITEFLPISSDGHLLLVRHLFGWTDEGLAFDAALHIGTLLALLLVFRATWLRILRGGEKPLLVALILGTIPGALAGVFGEGLFATLFRSLTSAGVGFLVTGVLLLLAERFRTRGKEEEAPLAVSWRPALLIGVAQAFALLPGLSRSGATMSVGMLQGFHRFRAVEFSFLLALPITLGASLEGFRVLLSEARPSLFPALLGMCTAFLVGWASIRFLLRTVRVRSFLPYTVYLFVVGGLTLLLTVDFR